MMLTKQTKVCEKKETGGMKPMQEQKQNVENKKIVEQTKMNSYEQEYASLKDPAEFWKASEGKHKVGILTEPENTEFTREDGTVVKQKKVEVELLQSKDGVGRKIWTYPDSPSKQSLRGQIVKLAIKRGKLAGVEFELLVQGTGKQRRYTIPEVLE